MHAKADLIAGKVHVFDTYYLHRRWCRTEQLMMADVDTDADYDAVIMK